jgi:hypothetical protein
MRNRKIKFSEYLLEPHDRMYLMEKMQELIKLHDQWTNNRYHECELNPQNKILKYITDKNKMEHIKILRKDRIPIQHEIDEKWFIIDAFILDMASKIIKIPKEMIVPFPYDLDKCKKRKLR